MTFDSKKACELCAQIKNKNWAEDDGIDIRYLNIKCAEMLPAALDRIEELERALIEERIWHYVIGGADECIVPDEKYPGEGDCYCVEEPAQCPAVSYLRSHAREQLHAEGLI
jgi:hypothetical protein